MRLLGIPTVIDRLLQQAVGQVISHQIRDGVSKITAMVSGPTATPQQAVLKAQEYINEGYQHIVDIDLEKLLR